MKQLKLIFTRDFNQWSNQLPRDLIVNLFPKIFGATISDQIIIFDGHTCYWYRFVDDLEKFKQDMLKLPLDHQLLQLEAHEVFRAEVKKLRQLMETNVSAIKDQAKFYDELKSLFIKMYPLYALSNFLPGPWAADFKERYGPKADPILELTYQSRLASEGLVKEVTNFMRLWLGPLLVKVGLPATYLKLLTVEETEDFVYRQQLPPATLLAERNKGFVVIQNKIYPTVNPQKILAEHNITIIEEKVDNKSLQGQTAFGNQIVQGRVMKIVNSDQIRLFKPGYIMVTPMTSPDYLSAMKQAKAIITDEGGITCHAAITARELKIPTIISTKFATRILKDDDVVEVDAERGIVRIIS